MAVRIKINGKSYDNLDNINLVLTFDAIASTFSFDAYFDPTNQFHRELFKPLSFHLVEISRRQHAPINRVYSFSKIFRDFKKTH